MGQIYPAPPPRIDGIHEPRFALPFECFPRFVRRWYDPCLDGHPRDVDQLVARAETVFKGTVTAKHSEWTGETATRHIVTFVTFQVEETYKGTPATEQTLRFLGGTVGSDTLEVPEMPRFEVGQKNILFVVGNGKQFCPLVGVAQGRFHVIRDEASGQERVFTNEGTPIVDTTKIGHVDAAGLSLLRSYVHSGTQAMTAEDFRAEILGKVAALAH